ncbi:MAG: helix-hairpin-helix domain-containing protein [Ilumatobacteraceae bacterium]
MPVEDISEEVHAELARPDQRPLPGPLGRLRPWIDWYGSGRLVAGGITIVVLVLGGWWLLRSPPASTEAGLPLAAAPPTIVAGGVAPSPAPTTTASGPILVHVAGAVAAPGVYELPAEARVGAAIAAAGGPVPQADPGSLNLAAALADGERVYVPVVGEAVPPPAAPSGASPTPSAPLDLNRATAEELDVLPGVGPSTATAIVDHRAQNGPFASVEDLEAVRGIGPAKLDALRDLVRV